MIGVEVVYGELQFFGGKLVEYCCLRKGVDIFLFGDFKDGGYVGLFQLDVEGQQVWMEKWCYNQVQVEIQCYYQFVVGIVGKVLFVFVDFVGQFVQQCFVEVGGFNGGNKVFGVQQVFLWMQLVGQYFVVYYFFFCGVDNGLIKWCKFLVLDGLLQVKG